jgi:hypothetical protein
LKSIIVMEIMPMMNHPISSPYIDIATTKGMLNHVKNGSMLLVSITNDHTLKSRMMGNYHVRFGSGGGEGDFFANHNHQELSSSRQYGRPMTPAMAAGLTDHLWRVSELLFYQVAPAPWVEPRPARQRKRSDPKPIGPKRPRGRPRKHPLPDPTVPKRSRGRPRKVR